MTDESMTEEKSGSKTLNWVLGCGAAILVVALLCGGGVWWSVLYVQEKAIEAIYAASIEAIEGTRLPQEQIDSMKLDLDRLKTAAEDWQIELDQLDNLEPEIFRVLSLGGLRWYEVHVVPQVAEFTPDEKADAVRQLQRLARGIQEGVIHPKELQSLNVKVEKGRDDDSYDSEDIRRDIAKVRRIVDEEGIIDEPFDVDVAREFTNLVDGLIE